MEYRAEQNGIASGINETKFDPDTNITREQIAVVPYKYAKYKGYDVSVGEDTNILSYSDFDEISEYAIFNVKKCKTSRKCWFFKAFSLFGVIPIK